MILRPLRALAAVLLGTAAGVIALAAPAQAAACPAGTGVTVVVNSGVGCDPDGGGRASDNFAAAGHQLRFASRAPGFVCRIDGAPANDPCVEAAPSDAYWGLFWSDGTTGTWTYSSLGVTALKVPKGGSVAFVFQGSSKRTQPGVSPQVAAPEPAQPTRSTGGGSTGSTGSGARDEKKAASPKRSTASVSPRAGTAPGSVATPSSAPTSGAAPAPSSSAPTTESAPPAAGESVEAAGGTDAAVQPLAQEESSSTSAPAVIAGGVLVALLAAAGGVVWRRRSAG